MDDLTVFEDVPAEELLTIAELATLEGVSRTTIQNWIREYEIPASGRKISDGRDAQTFSRTLMKLKVSEGYDLKRLEGLSADTKEKIASLFAENQRKLNLLAQKLHDALTDEIEGLLLREHALVEEKYPAISAKVHESFTGEADALSAVANCERLWDFIDLIMREFDLPGSRVKTLMKQYERKNGEMVRYNEVLVKRAYIYVQQLNAKKVFPEEEADAFIDNELGFEDKQEFAARIKPAVYAITDGIQQLDKLLIGNNTVVSA
jgi:hypothetical protein